jgi:CheY-like chemotaxis protein
VYLLLAAADGPFARGYVAMSIWPQDLLPAELAGAKGRRLVIDQSPEDQVTRFHHARKAYDALSVAGAIVRVSTYSGGHGWHDQPLPRLRAGLQWLFGEQQAPAPKWPAAPKAGANLLGNGGFEQGLDGWRAIDNSKRLQVEVTKAEHKEGKQALHLAKSGAMPLDLVVQDIELPAGGTLTCTASIKSKAAKNAWIKVWIYDQDGNALRDDVDLARVPADGDWQRVEKAWPCAGAVRATVQIVMVMGGDVWVDDVTLSVAK